MTTPKKTAKKLRDIFFDITELPGCCGAGVVNSFIEEESTKYVWDGNWGSRDKRVPVPGKYETPEEQAENCYKRILKRNRGDDGDSSYYDTGYRLLTITLVSKYRDDGKPPQFPALQALLKKKRWKVDHVFVNPNHGNEVTMFSKVFPMRKDS